MRNAPCKMSLGLRVTFIVNKTVFDGDREMDEERVCQMTPIRASGG